MFLFLFFKDKLFVKMFFLDFCKMYSKPDMLRIISNFKETILCSLINKLHNIDITFGVTSALSVKNRATGVKTVKF